MQFLSYTAVLFAVMGFVAANPAPAPTPIALGPTITVHFGPDATCGCNCGGATAVPKAVFIVPLTGAAPAVTPTCSATCSCQVHHRSLHITVAGIGVLWRILVQWSPCFQYLGDSEARCW
ncbi:hypothetical protein PUNSTDRAFT_55619 [Punctularia strigosozonata HHB-11173 SS5]|uniref:Uncharacterized protein n=1 Tax=Punctularia strigosozonata (strain HHB-11173) TaxID=741275 RepID=R7S3B8_PUNST|nr:uncharacterized protein PUNSTDRAFT_55619 [Punctularia strigosozonata HHB-11173 SS5]EIN04354.1 hypothetical protein PUNSTDRAFT_55619 [Punctularia strigosozonata HHB-11173 SS5]